MGRPRHSSACKNMIFAALVIERPPLEWNGLLGALGQWLQDAGLYAFLWLMLLGLAYYMVPEFRQRSPWGAMHTATAFLAGLSFVLVLVFLVLVITQGLIPDPAALKTTEPLPANASPP